MRRNLLDVLAGPPTGGPLTLVGDTGGEEIEEGELVSDIGVRYPIIRGIPRFVPQRTYGESFGIKWNRLARVRIEKT
jgi:uncharacterized protein YbaR (Trm112 family)